MEFVGIILMIIGGALVLFTTKWTGVSCEIGSFKRKVVFSCLATRFFGLTLFLLGILSFYVGPKLI